MAQYICINSALLPVILLTCTPHNSQSESLPLLLSHTWSSLGNLKSTETSCMNLLPIHPAMHFAQTQCPLQHSEVLDLYLLRGIPQNSKMCAHLMSSKSFPSGRLILSLQYPLFSARALKPLSTQKTSPRLLLYCPRGVFWVIKHPFAFVPCLLPVLY